MIPFNNQKIVAAKERTCGTLMNRIEIEIIVQVER